MRRIALSFLLVAALMTGTVTLVGCGNASVVGNLQAVVSGARDVLAAMSASDPNFARAQKFVTDAQILLDAYKAAVASNPNGCVDVASMAANIVTAFQASILP